MGKILKEFFETLTWREWVSFIGAACTFIVAIIDVLVHIWPGARE